MPTIDLTKEQDDDKYEFIFNSDGESIEYERGSALVYITLDGHTEGIWVDNIPLVVEALQRVQTLAKGN